MVSRLVSKTRDTYNEFPRPFWVLMGSTFIDRLGGALIFPFFAIYVTKKFNVDMLQVGVLFVIFTVSGMVGSFIGGAMTDKFGRRWMLMFGLIVSAMSAVSMALVNELAVFYTLGAVVGLLGNAGGPAQQAMVADLLPEEKRPDGYAVQRVVMNLAIAIGPAIGGILATWSYLALFLIDAATSLVTAVIVFFALPETKPELAEGQAEESVMQTMGGYGKVLSDRIYMAYLIVGILMGLVYTQMYSTLSVYLSSVHGYPEWGYGYILALNAGMVMLTQFWFTRRVKGRPPMLVIAAGAVFYMVGFAMYGFVTTYILFMVAMVIITIGEMIIAPIAQTLVAKFAPEDMRGRYMAIAGLTVWAIPSALGPLTAGWIMRYYDPRWVWWGGGLLSILVVAGYLWLHTIAGERLGETDAPMQEPPVPAGEAVS
ncbi:MAG: MFS transporter [Anaerolineae bacterium]|nr:MFS transporter [Anaerolineae bacterium]